MGNRAITEPLALTTDYVSLDGRYTDANGNPYASVAAAEAALGRRMNAYTVGLTVLVKEVSWEKAKEYWVQPYDNNGTTAYHLVPKGDNLADPDAEYTDEQKHTMSANINNRQVVTEDIEVDGTTTTVVRSMGFKVLKPYDENDPTSTLAAQVTGNTSSEYDTQILNTEFEVKNYYEIDPEVISYPITNTSQYVTISGKKYYYGAPVNLIAGQTIRITGTVVILNSEKTSVSNLRLDNVYRTTTTKTIYLAYTSTKTVTYKYALVIGGNNLLKINGGKIDNGVLDINNTQIQATDGWIGENLEVVGQPKAEVYPDWFAFDEDADKIERAIERFNSIRLYPRDYNIRRPINISTSFSIVGAGIPDFFGDYGSIKNSSYSASRLIGVGDIPCIIRVCQKTTSWVSCVIRGVDFRPGSGQTRLINGINWSTPNGPSRPVEITGCNFRGLNRGIYIYNKYKIDSMTANIRFTSTVTQIIFKTLAASDNWSATATISSKTLTINLTPKSVFIDTRTELEAIKDALRNATVTVGGVQSTAYYYCVPYDIYGLLTPNKTYTIVDQEDEGYESEGDSTTLKSSSTNIDILDIKNCNFYANNWGVYGNGQHCIMNMNFHDNNAEANVNGAIFINKAFSSIIIKNNLIEGQPTPINITSEQCYVEVSSNYLESSNPQTITIADSSSNAYGILNIFGNLTSTGSNDVTWNLSRGVTNFNIDFSINNVGRPGNNNIKLAKLSFNEQLSEKLTLDKIFLKPDFPFYKLSESATIININTNSTSYTDILDLNLPVAFHHTTGTDNLLTHASSASHKNFTEGLWRFAFLYKTSSITNTFYIAPTGSSNHFIDLTSSAPAENRKFVNKPYWVFHDYSVLQPINTRVTVYASVPAGNELWFSRIIAYKVPSLAIRKSLSTSYTSGKAIVVKEAIEPGDSNPGDIVSVTDYGYYKVDVSGLYRVLFYGRKTTNTTYGYAFYDENDNYIAGSATAYENSTTEYNKLVPSNAKWLKATILASNSGSIYADNVTGYKSNTSSIYQPDIDSYYPVRTSLTGNIEKGFVMQWNGQFIKWNGSYWISWPGNEFSPEFTDTLRGRSTPRNNKQVTITGGASSDVIGVLDGYYIYGRESLDISTYVNNEGVKVQGTNIGGIVSETGIRYYKIDVSGLDSIVFYGRYVGSLNYGAAFYDENDNYITGSAIIYSSSASVTTCNATVPSNAKWLKATCLNSAASSFYARNNASLGRIVKGSYPERYSLIEFNVENYKSIRFYGLETPLSSITGGYTFAKFELLEEEPADWTSPQTGNFYYKKNGDLFIPIEVGVDVFSSNSYYKASVYSQLYDAADEFGTKEHSVDVPEGYTHFITYSKYSTGSTDYITSSNFYIYGVEKSEYSSPKNMIYRDGFWKNPVSGALIIDDICTFEEAVNKYSKYTTGSTAFKYVQVQCTTPIAGDSNMIYWTGTLWKTIPDDVQVKVITPTYTADHNIVTLSCITTGATIYYTTDGTTPTTSSTEYTAPVTLQTSETLTAKAFLGGMLASDVVVYDNKVATPVVSIDNSGVLSISCDTTSATIYYTIDGTTPTTGSTEYTQTVQLSSGDRIKAFAIYSGMNDSDVSEEVVYTIPAAE